jgi:iron complex outermembrane receptor protein
MTTSPSVVPANLRLRHTSTLARLFGTVAASTLLLALAAQTAIAQDAAPQLALGSEASGNADAAGTQRSERDDAELRRNDNANSIETVIITANKRSESAQKVPTSVSVVSGASLERNEVRSAADVVRFIPNASAAMTESRSRPRWFIRGVGSNDPSANVVNPVGVYIDEVYLNSPHFQAFPTFDLDRVEVLRGPQGTLYGKNTVGGAINYLSRRPTFSPSGYVRAGLGNYDADHIEGAISGPVWGDKLAARLSVYKDDRGGIATNDVTGAKDFGKVNDEAARLQFLYRPSEDLDILVSAHTRTFDGTPIARYIEPAKPDNATFAGISTQYDDYGNEATDAPDVGASNVDGSTRINSQGALVSLNWTPGRYSFSSITAFENGRQISLSDGDFTPFEGSRSYASIRSSQISQEFRLTSPRDDRFNWIVGAHLFSEKFSSDSATATIATTAYLDPTTGAQRWRHTYFQDVTYDQQTDSYAAFGSGTFRVTPKFSLTAGLRYTSESRDAQINILNGPGEAATRRSNTTNPASPEVAGKPIITFLNTDAWWLRSSVSNSQSYTPFTASPSKTWNRWTWDITPQYKFNDDVLAYAKVARGFRSGTFQASATAANQFDPDGIAPEDLISYEGGIKSDWYDHRLRVNVSAFYYDYKSIQVLVQGVPVVTAGTTSFAARLISATGWSQGLEVEASAKPIPNLRFDAALAWLQTEYTDDFIPNNPNTGLFFGKGNEFTRAPHFSGTFGAEYTVPLSWGVLTFGTDWSYRTAQWFTVNAQQDDATKVDYRVSQYQRQKDYALGNARIGIASPDGDLELQLYVRNLTDQVYKVLTFGTQQGARQTTYGDPRTYGVTLSKKF